MPNSCSRRKAGADPQPSPPLSGLASPRLLPRKLVKIHDPYEGRGERVDEIATPGLDSELLEATVSDGARTFHLKLRLSADGVHEHGREEDLST